MVTRRSREHTKILRQSIVSSAKLRGMTSSDIVALLSEEGVVNPLTDEPWSITTINNDLREIEERWKTEMLRDVSEHRSRVLAELNEVKMASWKTGKLSLVLRAIDQEVGLLGLNELERMGVEIALTNLLKSLPKEFADELKSAIRKKVLNQKKSLKDNNLIPFNKDRATKA